MEESDEERASDAGSGDEEDDAEGNIGLQLQRELRRVAGDSGADDGAPELVPLPDGGPDFDWHAHALACYGGPWPSGASTFLAERRAAIEKEQVDDEGPVATLPDV